MPSKRKANEIYLLVENQYENKTITFWELKQGDHGMKLINNNL